MDPNAADENLKRLPLWNDSKHFAAVFPEKSILFEVWWWPISETRVRTDATAILAITVAPWILQNVAYWTFPMEYL